MPWAECKQALIYVLAVGGAFGWIALVYAALSLPSLSYLLKSSVWAAAKAMWLVPGALMLSAGSPWIAAAGMTVVFYSTWQLVLAFARPGKRNKRRAAPTSQTLFHYQPLEESPRTIPTIAGALVLQFGVYGLAIGYPIPAALCFATAAATWAVLSVVRGAADERGRHRALYVAVHALLSLLLTIALTALLLRTSQLQRAAEESARAKAAAQVNASQTVTTRLVNANAANGDLDLGFPGVVVRPEVKRSQRPRLFFPGAAPKGASAHSFAIPFTGEYQLYLSSSGKLPDNARIETGNLLNSLYRSTYGGTMETVAVQTFDPPLDIAQCGKLLVALTLGDGAPVIASLQLVADSATIDGGVDSLANGPNANAEFSLPLGTRPLLVHTIRISFRRLSYKLDENVRIAVEGFTLLPRS